MKHSVNSGQGDGNAYNFSIIVLHHQSTTNKQIHFDWGSFPRTDYKVFTSYKTETDQTGKTSPREMCEQSNYTIPPELQETLLDFTVHYLVEKPPDIIDFAMEFFSRLQAKRNNSHLQQSEDEDMESEEEVDFGE